MMLPLLLEVELMAGLAFAVGLLLAFAVQRARRAADWSRLRDDEGAME